jgi:hypothetical protein
VIQKNHNQPIYGLKNHLVVTKKSHLTTISLVGDVVTKKQTTTNQYKRPVVSSQLTHLSNLESHPVTHPQVTTCWRSESHRNVLFSGGFKHEKW